MNTGIESGCYQPFVSLGAVLSVPASELTTFQTGGPVDCVLRPKSYEDLQKATLLCAKLNVPHLVLGRGSNVLFPDEGYRGLVLRLDEPLYAPIYTLTRVVACAATQLSMLARDSVQRGLSGLERLCGIPGTLGGAVAMNAGAYNAEIGDVLSRVHVLRNGLQEWMDVDRSQMTYRHSPYSFPDCVVLEVELTLHADDGSAAQVMQECLSKRRDKQPLNYPSAGSTFKRPSGYFAGALIEECGLKGYREGGASVSTKHAGFVVNDGAATSADVLAVIRHVQQTVSEKTGVELETEINIIQNR